MNKAELISAMATESGLSKSDSKKALDAFLSIITDSLKSRQKISLVGFGTFSISERKERMGINPSTMAPIPIPAKSVVKFKPGTELSDKVQ